eukprot:3579928-Amphidinium_carterae.1
MLTGTYALLGSARRHAICAVSQCFHQVTKLRCEMLAARLTICMELGRKTFKNNVRAQSSSSRSS